MLCYKKQVAHAGGLTKEVWWRFGGCADGYYNEIELPKRPRLFFSAPNLNARRTEGPKGSHRSIHVLWNTTADLFLLAVVSFH